MSLVEITALHCDIASCGAEFVHRGFRYDARRQAAKAGWVSKGSVDYCPDHYSWILTHVRPQTSSA